MIPQFIEDVLRITLIQCVGLFGIFFVLGFLLAHLQKRIHTLYHSSIGWHGILWTAWIGTPIHEIGHIVFAKLFRHEIKEVALFQPNKDTGGLGHVEHGYNPHSIYQQIGNFFVGAAPLIWGTFFLFVLLYFFFPGGKELMSPLLTNPLSIAQILDTIKRTIFHFFTFTNISSWSFWLFLYVSFCVSSHMAPSKMDRQAMWKGFGWIVALLTIVNAIALSLNTDVTSYILSINLYYGILITLLTYAFLISLLHLFFAVIILLPIQVLLRR